jgi:aspartyl-tRNA(Asn)/glutamyl-tRNA(Gln) amidotransferase subunit C
MSLTATDVARIADLARIELEPSETTEVLSRLNAILGLIETMNAVDTAGIEPMSHTQEMSLRLRDDVVTDSDSRALFQSIAPQVDAGLYLVPKVIE